MEMMIPEKTFSSQTDHSIKLQPREWWRMKCKLLIFFCKQVLSTAWADKFQNFGVLQKHLCNFLQDKDKRKKFISVFRGSFKTTVILGFCLWLFCWAVANGESLAICYNTSSKDNAAIFSEDFRQTLLNCKKLHWIFPEVPSDPSAYLRWTQKMIEYKAVKFHVSSLETRQVMRHYQIIINDDLVNDDNAFSETERKTIIRKWKLQKSILTKYKKFNIGMEVDQGTPYHHKDLISYIMKEVDTYDKFIVPYAIPDDKGILSMKRRVGMLTMPEMYCWEDFEEKRKEMGPSLFATQYELKIVDDGERLASQSDLRYWTDLPRLYHRIMIVDPGGVNKDDDPETGIYIGDCDQAGYIYSLYAEEVNVKPYEMIKLMEKLQTEFNPDDTYMEREKYSITISDTLEHLQSRLNFSFASPYGRDKNSRIKRIRQHVETGRFLLGHGMTTLEDRLINFPDCPKHLLDCVSYFLDKMQPPKRGVDRTPEEVRVSDFEEEMARGLRLVNNREEGLENDRIF